MVLQKLEQQKTLKVAYLFNQFQEVDNAIVNLRTSNGNLLDQLFNFSTNLAKSQTGDCRHCSGYTRWLTVGLVGTAGTLMGAKTVLLGAALVAKASGASLVGAAGKALSGHGIGAAHASSTAHGVSSAHTSVTAATGSTTA